MGLFDNTLIVYTTDHGEPFGDHGIIRKCRPWLYQELVHIPFIIKHPEIAHSKRISALIETPDLMPTILDFLGIEGPKEMHGRSLLPLMAGEVDKIRDYAYIGIYNRSWAIKDYEWSYMFWFEDKVYHENKPPELYNLKDDPTEQNNLIDKEPGIAKDLDLKLRKFVADLEDRVVVY